MTREQAKREIDSLDYYLQNHTDDYGEESHTAMMMAIKALSQEPICPSHGIDCEDCPAYDPCGDVISRQGVLDLAKKGVLVSNGNYKRVCEAINELPSVNPTKTGHWIQTNEFFINQNGQFIYRFICSECKSLSYFRKSNKKAIGANFCPNCGEKMESEEQE